MTNNKLQTGHERASLANLQIAPSSNNFQGLKEKLPLTATEKLEDLLKEKSPLSPNNNSEYQSTSELKEKSPLSPNNSDDDSPNNNSDDVSVSNPEKMSNDVNNCESLQQKKKYDTKGGFFFRQ